MIPGSYFERFEAQKYRNSHPVQRALIRRFTSVLHDLVLEAGPLTSVLEVGLGEGFISGYLSEQLPRVHFTGVELDGEAAARARRLFPRIDVREGSAYDLGSLPVGHDLVICAEVLEHLAEPERAIAEMLRVRPRRLVLSVPHEPFFMLGNLARLKNVSRLGNDVDHVNHWGRRGFRRMLDRHLDVLRLTSSFPWILALAAPR